MSEQGLCHELTQFFFFVLFCLLEMGADILRSDHPPRTTQNVQGSVMGWFGLQCTAVARTLAAARASVTGVRYISLFHQYNSSVFIEVETRCPPTEGRFHGREGPSTV
ncbi:hypothetical protein BO99DRAFT_154150 [Aspergillus violaceofuscus CBS 115571]|uniref:Secreted protein n=1 Tax=Aspergillus violaceofuscus (strain CBS 115571) TaxID=1450538 RepID=A0A2V5HP02_ASPV1|nr:hypothetical protein BO99DRAFT_154150 [Aspergillus violaceofuscus CBS 115571]